MVAKVPVVRLTGTDVFSNRFGILKILAMRTGWINRSRGKPGPPLRRTLRRRRNGDPLSSTRVSITLIENYYPFHYADVARIHPAR
jgi:hypothetical protein